MFCQKCGKEIPDTAKFCTGCGNPVEQNQPKTKFCKHCGQEIDAACVVCPKCGKHLKNGDCGCKEEKYINPKLAILQKLLENQE